MFKSQAKYRIFPFILLRGLLTVQELIFRCLAYRVPVSQVPVIANSSTCWPLAFTTAIHKGSDTVAAHSALLKLDSTSVFCHRSNTISVAPLLYPLRIISYFCRFFQKHSMSVLSSIIFSFFLSFFFSFFVLFLTPIHFFSHFLFFLSLYTFSLHSIVFFNPRIFPFSTYTFFLCTPLLSGCGPSPSGNKCSFQLLHSLSKSRKKLRG